MFLWMARWRASQVPGPGEFHRWTMGVLARRYSMVLGQGRRGRAKEHHSQNGFKLKATASSVSNGNKAGNAPRVEQSKAGYPHAGARHMPAELFRVTARPHHTATHQNPLQRTRVGSWCSNSTTSSRAAATTSSRSRWVMSASVISMVFTASVNGCVIFMLSFSPALKCGSCRNSRNVQTSERCTWY